MIELAIAFGVGVLGVIFSFFLGQTKGASKERAKQDAERLEARTIADEIDDAVAGRETSENRERLKRW